MLKFLLLHSYVKVLVDALICESSCCCPEMLKFVLLHSYVKGIVVALIC